MKKQNGFTLIELIMVIVILGILSAFALPRFADLSGNAETASVEGARASVASSNAIVHASALANDSVDQNGSVTLEGQAVTTAWGYPTVADIDIAASLATAEYTVTEVQAQTEVTPAVAGSDTAAIAIIMAADAVNGDACFTFTESVGDDAATVGAMATWTDSNDDDTVDDGECA